MARHSNSRREDPMKEAIGIACFTVVVIAVVIGLIVGPDKAFDFLFWVSRRVAGFIFPDLYSSP